VDDTSFFSHCTLLLQPENDGCPYMRATSRLSKDIDENLLERTLTTARRSSVRRKELYGEEG